MPQFHWSILNIAIALANTKFCNFIGQYRMLQYRWSDPKCYSVIG